jgi:hypothetical protein
VYIQQQQRHCAVRSDVCASLSAARHQSAAQPNDSKLGTAESLRLKRSMRRRRNNLAIRQNQRCASIAITRWRSKTSRSPISPRPASISTGSTSSKVPTRASSQLISVPFRFDTLHDIIYIYIYIYINPPPPSHTHTLTHTNVFCVISQAARPVAVSVASRIQRYQLNDRCQSNCADREISNDEQRKGVAEQAACDRCEATGRHAARHRARPLRRPWLTSLPGGTVLRG